MEEREEISMKERQEIVRTGDNNNNLFFLFQCCLRRNNTVFAIIRKFCGEIKIKMKD